MKSNFDFLKQETQFSSFTDVAIEAERVFHISLGSAAIGCRTTIEFTVKWMYDVDGGLTMPYEDKLSTLINTPAFRAIVPLDTWRRLDYIRRLGNIATHQPKNLSKDQVLFALQNLHVFLNFIACSYGKDMQQTSFDPSLAEQAEALPSDVLERLDKYEQIAVELEAAKANAQPSLEQKVILAEYANLQKENESMKAELTARREIQVQNFVLVPLNPSEAVTRKAYIDVLLIDAGWQRNKNWIEEYELPGMPNKSEVGYADYVLFGDDGRPLAVIEAKKTSVDIAVGRQQAKLYADLLEKKFGQRPIIYMTNGFVTRMWIDGKNGYPERRVSSFYSKRDLEKEFHKMTMRSHLDNVRVDDNISGRYYQKEAIRNVCYTFDRENRRKALLVMATGSGKTRTVAGLVDVLMQNGWVKNVLFLADRTSLVLQAKRAFANMLPNLSITNLAEDKEHPQARAVFSTYQTIMNCIDNTQDEEGNKLFTCGHFDLIICDEAHRSIYNKYRDIFTYFDALLVGLTATPKDDIDRNTYDTFELESGVPTYGYELEQAVDDQYLVDYSSIETNLRFISAGITYDQLSEEEKQEYEDKFADGETGEIPESIGGSALNEWVFNYDTISKVLNTLITHGIKIDYGNRIGKTVIFAKNHLHAEKIFEVWNKEFPHYPSNYCRVIDNYTNYAQSLIDDFSKADGMPQIVISVDMLDTGIDVPEILNLVFFKKVLSKAKFWQMIGRGTRLCPGLLDGDDKKEFYIFDFCGNFEFFRVTGHGQAALSTKSLSEQIFNLKTEIAYKLQDLAYQTDDLIVFRKGLVSDMLNKVHSLNRENFAVRQHMQYVEFFSHEITYQALTYENTTQMAEHIAPLVEPDIDDVSAVRFDALMYQIERAYLVGKENRRGMRDLLGKINALTRLGTIPAIKAQGDFLNILLHTNYLEGASINEFEKIRSELRDLMKYVPSDPQIRYDTNFTDTIDQMDFHDSDLSSNHLENYKKKINFYIRQHRDNPAITKLKTNVPLSPSDVIELEKILWSELGSKQDYEKEYGDMPLGELIRSIVGLDIQAANEAFSQFLNDVSLDPRQTYFVKQIVDYIVKNGMMKDLRVLTGSPFNDRGSVADVFADVTIWSGIMRVIERINENAKVA